MNQIILKIDGMSCATCAMTIENKLKTLDGIITAKVSYATSDAAISYDDSKIDVYEIKAVIDNLGYKVVSSNTKANSKMSNNSWPLILGMLVVGFALYLIIKNTIGFNYIPEVSQSMGYGLLFVVGLLTSVHCIAMCGGINLSQCISSGDNTEKPLPKKLIPSFLYNLGRVISYTVIGGLVGALGSVISFSGSAKGIVAIVAGVFMLIMGLNMLNISPALRKFIPRMPKSIATKIHSAKKGRGPLVVGLLNGFMPCGPLQTMQIYALGTGSFIAGALSMFLFSLGTVPLMFAFGALSSLLSSKFTKKLMAASAVLVMLLGVIMFSRGLNQLGVSTAIANDDVTNIAQLEGNVQTITTEMEPNFYEPFVVQEGVPVVWTINVEEGDLNGCNNPITIPKYGIEKELVVGENVIQFTPNESDNITYTCWMGMISSNISVVSDINNISEGEIVEEPADPFNGNGAACGCCSTG